MEHLVKIRDLQERKPKAAVDSRPLSAKFSDKDTEMSRMGVKALLQMSTYAWY